MGSRADCWFAFPAEDIPGWFLPGWDGNSHYTNQRQIRMGELVVAKKPLPPNMDSSNVGKNPPFVPPTYKMAVGPPLPAGTFQEAGLYLKLYDYIYAGQTQTGVINIKIPKPV